MDDRVSAAVQSILFVVKQEVAFCRIFQSFTNPNKTKKTWKSRVNSSLDQREGQNYYIKFLVSVLYEFQVSWLKKCQVLLLHILITLLFNSSSVCSRILSTKSMLINPVAFHHSSLSGFCKFNQSIHK